jgi:hypothetical protein
VPPSPSKEPAVTRPRARAKGASPLVPRIERFIHDAGALVRSARYRDLAWVISNATDYERGEGKLTPDAEMEHRTRLVADGEPLAADLRRAGLDPRAVREVGHLVEPGGEGPDVLLRRWEKLKFRLLDVRDAAQEAAARRGRRKPSAAPAPTPSDDEEPSGTAFQPADWRSLSPKEKADRVHHGLALIAMAESHYRDPPSWRRLERETGVSARKLRKIKRLADAHRDAERAAAQRHQESLHRHAAKPNVAV